MTSLIDIVKQGSLSKFTDYLNSISAEAQEEALIKPLKEGMNILHLCSS